ncbi:MAG: DUF1294 domain-containing protein [Eubacteriales bacterium]|nr:DUF1294 domain-containing protein [Eubacteriales bacterium]
MEGFRELCEEYQDLMVLLAAINGGTFALFAMDKYRAIHKKWRIPEKKLMMSAALGGALGAFLAMVLLHHKTRKARFRYGVPALLAVQAALLAGVLEVSGQRGGCILLVVQAVLLAVSAARRDGR